MCQRVRNLGFGFPFVSPKVKGYPGTKNAMWFVSLVDLMALS